MPKGVPIRTTQEVQRLRQRHTLDILLSIAQLQLSPILGHFIMIVWLTFHLE